MGGRDAAVPCRFSNTSTECPRRARNSAASEPTSPAPTTATRGRDDPDSEDAAIARMRKLSATWINDVINMAAMIVTRAARRPVSAAGLVVAVRVPWRGLSTPPTAPPVKKGMTLREGLEYFIMLVCAPLASAVRLWALTCRVQGRGSRQLAVDTWRTLAYSVSSTPLTRAQQLHLRRSVCMPP
jgi:hypothetical protein